jgi:hypothetical protein
MSWLPGSEVGDELKRVTLGLKVFMGQIARIYDRHLREPAVNECISWIIDALPLIEKKEGRDLVKAKAFLGEASMAIR